MPVNLNVLKNLSLFFFASNADELFVAYLALAHEHPAPSVDDWSAVEFSFNHLFVGPRALLAPPYASIYLDGDEARLMGASTEKMRYLYEMLGLTSPWLNKIPDDHIALELDALWQIESAMLQVQSVQLNELHAYLLNHLQSWVPKFTARINTVDDVHPAILYVSDRLNAVLLSRESATAENAA